MNYANGGTQESGFHRLASGFGKIAGAGAAIISSPKVFGKTWQPVYGELCTFWSPKISTWLAWAFCFAEAAVIGIATALLITWLLTDAVAALAARRFRGG